MVLKFDKDAMLLLIDVQEGIGDIEHWGGPQGRRNNPQAEVRMQQLLAAWRRHGLPVALTLHDSREANSPLRLGHPGGVLKKGFAPAKDELVLRKDVNSAFIGTPLELELRRRGVTRLVVAGFFTNMCISTTVRMANNLGYDTYLIHDACACTNRRQLDGTDLAPEVVHEVTVASLHGEFCTALAHTDAIDLLDTDRPDLKRVQGNE